MYLTMVEAQQSPKQRQISTSFLLLLLTMVTMASFCLCGTVYVNYIVLNHVIMRGFFNYSGTSLVSQL